MLLEKKSVKYLIEVEVKVQISSPDAMRRKFEENNGIYQLSLIHEDTYFNMPKGLRNFKQSDEALRLRKSIEFNKENRKETEKNFHYLTYKGKKLDLRTKTRKEIELKIENANKMSEILKELGFQEIFTIKKQRELYEFTFQNHRIDGLIDYLPILNKYFIEVEMISDSIDNLNSYKKIIFRFLNLLGIKEEESIIKSYLELILDDFKEL